LILYGLKELESRYFTFFEGGGELFYLGRQNGQIVAGPAALCGKSQDILGA